MGIIMRNNIAYSGGGGSETVELSMAEYEAREAAGAIDSDTWYLIYDANDSYNAKKIVYDNAESGMEASTVQGAIDELNSNLDTLQKLLEGGIVTSEHGTFATPDNMVKDSTKDFIVNFEKPFNKIPDVILTSSNSYIKVSLLEVTKGGFSARCTCTYGGNEAVISWNATADIA